MYSPGRAGENARRTGYMHPLYTQSLSEYGRPIRLARSGGWLLERVVPGTQARDAVGCYPRFFCDDWTALPADLDSLSGELVSCTLVTDPFTAPHPEQLTGIFDRVRPFKEHFVVELAMPLETTVKSSHRANARKALRGVKVRVCEQPEARLAEWNALFDSLVRRHAVTGIRAFSPAAFALQLKIPGLVMFEAWSGDELVGLDLWYQQGEVAYGHLVAFNDRGYALRASYATKWTMLEYFKERVRWVDLGAGAGLTSRDDGLTAFKSGWANGVRPVYLCGKVLQAEAYDRLCDATATTGSDYFPAYRKGEMA